MSDIPIVVMSCISGWVFLTHWISTTISWDKEAYIARRKADTWQCRKRTCCWFPKGWNEFGGASRATYPEWPLLAVQSLSEQRQRSRNRALPIRQLCSQLQTSPLLLLLCSSYFSNPMLPFAVSVHFLATSDIADVHRIGQYERILSRPGWEHASNLKAGNTEAIL